MRAKHFALTAAVAMTLSGPLAWSQQQQPQTPDAAIPGDMQSQERGTLPDTRIQPSMPSHQDQAPIASESADTADTINPALYVDKDVVNTQGDKVGEVDKLVTYRQTAKIAAVIDAGGFLGIGEKSVVVPIEQLRPSGDKVVLDSTISADELKKGTPYEPSQFSALEAQPTSD